MKQSTDKLKKIFIAARIRKQLDGMPHGIYGKTGLAIVLIASIASGYIGGQVTRSNSVSLTSTNPSANRQVISSESELISQIADDVGKSVVSINVTTEETRRSYFGDQTQTGKSAGTGVIISDDGVIVTNRHVLPKESTAVSITLSDGSLIDNVEVIGRTADSDPLDIAFLKIQDLDGKKVSPIILGDSAEVEVGDKVIAIGNALGQFQNTVTSGIISGYGRSLEASDNNSSETLQNLFQTDAAINQGNSGGPLVDVQGELIGINTAVAADGAQGIGFAIPVNDIRGLIKSVLEDGKLERPYLGVRYITLTEDITKENDLKVNNGAYIIPSEDGSSIMPDSPAAKAGLKEKDIIVKVNDASVDEQNSLISLLGRYGINEKVTLTVVRDGLEKRVGVTLQAAPTQ